MREFTLRGVDFTQDASVREALSDPARQSFLVYPAEDADDLSSMTDEEVVAQFRQGAMFWIVDGSWSTARKMVHQSENLKNLPKVAFNPTHRSQFRIRRQPKDFCYSTIEAIHYILKRCSDASSATSDRTSNEASSNYDSKRDTDEPFDNLLRVFNRMVELQIDSQHQRIQHANKGVNVKD